MQLNVSMEQLVRFAAVMCTESCIMTGLNIAGYDYRYMILESWNLLYESETVLAGKKIDSYDLQLMYGIETTRISGDIQTLIDRINKQQIVLVATDANLLGYYPRNQLILDTSIFKHQILIYSYNADNGEFLMADPIVGHMGTITAEEIVAASVDREKLQLWCMIFPQENKTLPLEQIYKRAITINYRNTRISARSYLTLKKDIRKLSSLSPEQCENWLNQNNLTLTTIVNTRQKVWDCFCSFNIITPKLHQSGSELLDLIIKSWVNINFLLMKFRRNPQNVDLLYSVQQKIDYVQKTEFELLHKMYKVI